MSSSPGISDAGLYTDFSGLQQLKTRASSADDALQANEATIEVAKQFESLFLQMMLKSMREASITDESADSDQTKFYQEMFDKQIALDLANNGKGLGIAAMLERDLSGGKHPGTTESFKAEIPKANEMPEINDYENIKQQINLSSAVIKAK